MNVASGRKNCSRNGRGSEGLGREEAKLILKLEHHLEVGDL